MTVAAQTHKGVMPRLAFIFACGAATLLPACGSVPGETLASGGVRRDVSRRILAQANAAAPECRNQRISDTEVVEVYPDGRVAAERWTVEQCGARRHYQVIFPPAGKAGSPQVRPE